VTRSVDLDQLHPPPQQLRALAAGTGSDVVSVAARLARVGLLAARHLIRFVHRFISSTPLSAAPTDVFTHFAEQIRKMRRFR
jgi:hypothetical protein